MPIHHYFHGYLAGFSVRSGRLESREVIECLYACREGLDYRDFESLGKGMKVSPLPLAPSLRACSLPPAPARTPSPRRCCRSAGSPACLVTAALQTHTEGSVGGGAPAASPDAASMMN